ncbi:MAG TPA: methylmalonyl-CoA mutase family protein [Puia sp.]|nr:methylmalonyl-CoA mutase family protein [Puia sp.]
MSNVYNMAYTPHNKVRLVTAAALFDGHDAAINIMRRLLQSKGAEIIHLGHNRSVAEIVECAIEEDVQGIAITSYQGGHLEFFKYMKDLLDENGCGHIRLFGGGGGTILPREIEELHQYGITRIYSPDDGRRMGLEGMIEDVIRQCDFPLNGNPANFKGEMKLGEWKDIRKIARAISNAENGVGVAAISAATAAVSVSAGRATAAAEPAPAAKKPLAATTGIPVIGITGTGGAGKSSVTDELVRRYLHRFVDKTLAVISVDPSKKKTGGALLGDRIRMNAISSPRAYMRSLATRESDKALSAHVQEAIDICKEAGYDLVILESAGVGQSDMSILDYVDLSLYVMTPEYGAASQLEKINMLDYADLVVLNKFDKAGALDALHDIRKQYKRNHGLWTAKDDDLPIVGTIASQFNDAGINELFDRLMETIGKKTGIRFGETEHHPHLRDTALQSLIIPSSRVRYLSEITAAIRDYNKRTDEQVAIASRLYKLTGALEELPAASTARRELEAQKEKLEQQLLPVCKKLIEEWEPTRDRYRQEYFEYEVRGKVIRQPLYIESLSRLRIPRIAVPRFSDWGDILRWRVQENFPGKFPFTAGTFPIKRSEEDPTRMFAGEGGPERTNKRFHYVSAGQPAKRLSTAFDSVTLYGEDPDYRPDIYGKIGNAGVSIATIDDAKKLYSGFDLCDPRTSVSMTINGPAPILLAFFLNTAIDQQCEKYLAAGGAPAAGKKTAPKAFYHNSSSPTELPEGNDGLGLALLGLSGDEILPRDIYEKIKEEALSQVRGTVQADILKEDQAQNTCIFSTEFALRLMGDVQAWFIDRKVRNFYSVSISGYHIAEAGANPVTQLAFTLANGFTYVEYYLSRGMSLDDFAPNLSFFFSNGMDPEYSVIGRVARRIWAKAMKQVYKGNSRSQKLKYHIQTSGRSLHAQEIDFNDIRTTLQALYAIYDNCNSLHTNAYDEAITTPTEASVRRAMAIQLIINRELGTARTENFIQGSFAVEELTDLVEEAVLAEFDRLTDRGGVLGAMERMYQRNKIQEESLQYESLKHSGELPIIGVNTFLGKEGSPTILPGEVIRSTTEEKDQQIRNLQAFRERNADRSQEMLQRLQRVAVNNGNLFNELMETVKYCTLGEITNALYEVGGQYRRSM